MSKLYQTFNHLIVFTSLHGPYHFTLATFLSEFVVKYPKPSSFFLYLLMQKLFFDNSSLTLRLIPAPYYLKSISLLLITTTLTYLSTISSCMSAAGEDTSEPEISHCIWWKTFCYPSPSHLTPETFLPLLYVSFFRFFRYLFLAYWDHYRQFARFDSFKPLKKYYQVTLSNEHMNHLFWV